MTRPDLNNELVTSSEIAAMLDVTLAAVSNFKKRHEDFPDPAFARGKERGATTLYWRDEVLTWIDNRYEGGVDGVVANLEAKAADLLAQARLLRARGT